MIIGLSVLTFLLSLFGVFLVRRHVGDKLIDIPNERSSHVRPTPRGGGIAFVIAFALGSVLLFIFKGEAIVCRPIFWLILIALIGVGIVDDRLGVSVKLRYLVQFVVTSGIVLYIDVFPFPILEHWGQMGFWISFILTVIGMTAMINFYNFMDGIDGIVAGVSVVQLVFLALWFRQPEWWLLVSALLGFLFWNWSPAKIFMGDVGSTFLGCIIMIAFLAYGGNTLQHWTALVITFPLTIDAVYTIIRRLLRRENIFQAHRSHLYQRLHQAEWSHAKVASAYILLTFIIGLMVHWSANTGAIVGTFLVMGGIAIVELYLAQKKNKPSIIKSP